MSNQNEYSINELDKYIKYIEKIENALNSEKLYRYLERNMYSELLKICEQEDVASIQRGDEYMQGNDSEIEKNSITIFNDSQIDIQAANTFFNESAKQNYPEFLSLSKLIEYGTGIEGVRSGVDTNGEWEYDLNNHGDSGWDWNNTSFSQFPSHTLGQEGKAIFYKLQLNVEKNINKWIEEFLSEYIEGE